MTELDDAWAELHAANDRLHGDIGKPRFDERRNEWSVYMFDPRERPKVATGRGSGQRSHRLWSAGSWTVRWC